MIVDQAKVLAEVETWVMDKALAEARNVVKVGDGAKDRATVEVLVARKTRALAEARDVVKV